MFVWHHAPSAEYWPLWARQVGSMIQILPLLMIPIIAIIQSYRFLNKGPTDILEVSTRTVGFLFLNLFIETQKLSQSFTDILYIVYTK